MKLTGQDRYLARSRTYEPGSYFELWVSPCGHVRCTCPRFTYRAICKHAEAPRATLDLSNSRPARPIGDS